MKPLEPKPPDPCSLAFPVLSWNPSCSDSSLNLLWAETSCQGCSIVLDVDGFPLPCLALNCSRDGIVCLSVIAHRPTRILKAIPLKLSIAFIGVLIAPLEPVGRALADSNLSFIVEESPICLGLCCCSEQSVTKGHFLPVSFIFRLLVFRSESKVSPLLLFPFPFRAPCCPSLHLGFSLAIAVSVISLPITQVSCVLALIQIPSLWLCSIKLLGRSFYVCACGYLFLNCDPCFCWCLDWASVFIICLWLVLAVWRFKELFGMKCKEHYRVFFQLFFHGLLPDYVRARTDCVLPCIYFDVIVVGLWPLLGLCMHTPFQTLVVGVQCTLCGFRFSLFSTTILKGQLQPVVNMCRMPVGMVVKPPHRRWLFTYLKRIISSSSAVGFALCVYWGLPFVWLSLLLERLIAPKQEPMWFRFCWQLSFFQIVWDEVKGKKPFVYEDMLSGTSIASLLDLSRDICMFVWCLGIGSWPYYSWQPRRAESRLDVCIRVCDATDSTVVPFTLVPCCSVGMYYSWKLVFSFFFQLEFPVMFVVERLQCIRGNAVSRTDGCCIPSVISCNVSIFRD